MEVGYWDKEVRKRQMDEMRRTGYFIKELVAEKTKAKDEEYISKITNDVRRLTGCEDDHTWCALRQGGISLSADMMKATAEYFSIPLRSLIFGNPESYANACLYENTFLHEENKDLLLDIIKDYISLREKTVPWRDGGDVLRLSYNNKKRTAKQISTFDEWLPSKPQMDFINNFISKYCSDAAFLKNGIFSRLEKQSGVIVLYFTMDNEFATKGNKGFYIPYEFPNKVTRHFVYLNTAWYRHDLTMTAAHELGHVLGLIEAMRQDSNITVEEEKEERLISRFAAKLMMPEDKFRENIRDSFKLDAERSDMILVITKLMNIFSVSYKSIVYRLYELGIIPLNRVELARSLYNDYTFDNSQRESSESSDFKRSREYANSKIIPNCELYNTDREHRLEVLKEMLDMAKREQLEEFTKEWRDNFRARFNLAKEE